MERRFGNGSLMIRNYDIIPWFCWLIIWTKNLHNYEIFVLNYDFILLNSLNHAWTVLCFFMIFHSLAIHKMFYRKYGKNFFHQIISVTTFKAIKKNSISLCYFLCYLGDISFMLSFVFLSIHLLSKLKS